MIWSANISLEVLFLMSWVCAELAKHNTVKSTFVDEVNRHLTRKGRVNDGHASNNEASFDSKVLENEDKIYVPNWKYIRGKGLYLHLIYYCCYLKPKTYSGSILACTLKLCYMGL